MLALKFNSLIALWRTFPNEAACIKHLEKLYWDDSPVSPFDAASKVYRLSNGQYRCKNTGKNFNVKTGTMFVFTDTETGEELANSFHYFQVSSDIPLPAGGIRQIYFQSDIVYTYPKQSKKITCSIYLDKKLWKTFDIKYKFLTSNRIQ